MTVVPSFYFDCLLPLRARNTQASPAAVKAMVEDSGTGVEIGGTTGLPETMRLSILLFPLPLEAPSNKIRKAALGLSLSPRTLFKSKL